MGKTWKADAGCDPKELKRKKEEARFIRKSRKHVPKAEESEEPIRLRP